MKKEKALVKKALIIGCIWLIPSLGFDYLGINVYHLWDNSTSLLSEYHLRSGKNTILPVTYASSSLSKKK